MGFYLTKEGLGISSPKILNRFPSATLLILFLPKFDTDLSVVDKIYTFVTEEKTTREAGLCCIPRHTYIHLFNILRSTRVHGLRRCLLITRRFSLYETHLIKFFTDLLFNHF